MKIHAINEHDYNTIFKFVYKGIIDDGDNEESTNEFEKDLMLNKKQMIFYGPPGTGKTYKAREIAVDFIERFS
jgi:DNA replication protein DnaC